MKNSAHGGVFHVAYARSIFPERRQREQTYTDLFVPLTTALTLRILGFQVLLVLRLEWETLCPKATPLPQTLHLAILTPPKISPEWDGILYNLFVYINQRKLLYHIKCKKARLFLNFLKFFRFTCQALGFFRKLQQQHSEPPREIRNFRVRKRPQ